MKAVLRLARGISVRLRKSADKSYVKNKLKKRKGKCKKCGKCCRNCIYLDKKKNLCRTYRKRPFFCYREFPLERRDQELWCVSGKCGYKFK